MVEQKKNDNQTARKVTVFKINMTSKVFCKGAVSGEMAAPVPWWVWKMLFPQVALVGCGCGKRKQNST